MNATPAMNVYRIPARYRSGCSSTVPPTTSSPNARFTAISAIASVTTRAGLVLAASYHPPHPAQEARDMIEYSTTLTIARTVPSGWGRAWRSGR